ncbi:hypothetical protein GMORB2_7610 [Geosmithia morbida]|uniref:Tat pathway signal sequence domain protein n=1 Tax=Geosmithia morbida TaxID=1094350 RepID=A0A9P4YUF1_9HYPO|nr:uncharacterized protein GMORB2_7610 [Geosmithia morbida]KAF4122017.1 hypothetical protein GMORB2_7610 [Geosmithia morbida]
MPRLPAVLVAFAGLFAGGAFSLPTNGEASTVSWIDDDAPSYSSGTTFGVPWSQGKLYPNQTSFSISAAGGDVASDSWVTAYWRDGSIKWTAHALGATDSPQSEYTVKASAKTSGGPKGDISVADSSDSVSVDTGNITVTFPKSGSSLIGSIKTAGGKTVGQDGKLVLHSQSALVGDVSGRANQSVSYYNFESKIANVSVTKDTTVRALVTVGGNYQVTADGGDHDDWLPFTVRFYLYSGSNAIRVIHSIVFDGDQDNDFVSALGIRLQVPLADEELYDRHVRLAGQDGGFFSEAVKGITGLRRDPGVEVRAAQFEGRQTPNISTWDTRVSSRLNWVPSWNDFRLSQLSADGFSIQKRTESGYTWLTGAAGTRSGGLGYLGGATVGGVAVGLRDFWQQHPAGIDIADAASDSGSITLWLYSPDAEPLDLRPFHDGLGLDTYEKQLDALEITYEDYEPGFDTPKGIAKTHEAYIYAFDATPTVERLSTLNSLLSEPPVLLPEPAYIRETKGVGSYWDVPDTTSDKARALEDNLDFLHDYYQAQVKDRHFYGFLHYGDFMHSYDENRHAWRYDVGGYGWDNSELSPNLFFWQHFLRTGRADVYRFSEALTRHSGEVDVYHIGDWKGVGTRHGVLHYGDSAKQSRIAQPQYRRYFFYLSGGDERVGDLLDETLDMDQVYGHLDAQRKVRTDGWLPEPGKPASVNLGTDWAALAAAWLIGWERRGPRWEESREKLTRTAAAIANLTNGFVTGSALYDIDNRTLLPPPSDPDNEGLVSVSHLSAVFGLPEVISEALEYWGEEETPAGFKDAWLDYCYYYGAGSVEQTARYGEAFAKSSLLQGHSRLSAFYYSQTGNTTVGERAWTEFYSNQTDSLVPNSTWTSERITAPYVPVPVDEATWVSTNSAAQFGLAAIQNLAWARKTLDSSEA